MNEMIPVSLHENGLPCRCETVCDYRQSWITAGSPSELQGYIVFSKKGFEYKTPIEKLQCEFVMTKYCDNK